MRRRTRTLTGAGTAIALTGLLLLTGCTNGSSSDSRAAGGSAVSSEVGDGAGPAQLQKLDGQAADSAGNGTQSNAQAEKRQVVSTGHLSLTVKDPIGAAETAADAVATADGRVDDRTEQPATDTRQASASLTLRIPADRLDATVERLKKLGTVDDFTLKADDVTTSVKDVDARVRALQASVDRLLALMAKADDTKDLISLESALSDRQADLDSLKAQQSYLKDQVAYATLTLQLNAPGVVAAGAPDSFWSGLGTGWQALVAAGAGLLVVLGVLLPWLVVVAIIGGAVLVVIRSRRRARVRRLAE